MISRAQALEVEAAEAVVVEAVEVEAPGRSPWSEPPSHPDKSASPSAEEEEAAAAEAAQDG